MDGCNCKGECNCDGCPGCGNPTFDAAPKDCDIPTTHPIGDDIILEEK